ncbi:MAG: type II secretion system F family protein [Candidatus Woesearchaeota archaeon]
MYRLITRLIPGRIREHLYSTLAYSRVKVNKQKFLGFVLISSLGLALGLSLLISRLFHISFFVTLGLSIIVLELGIYFSFSLKADATAKFVESILPDALQLMSSNLRAGLTTDKALLLSARPEFGVLSEEINEIGKKIALGEDIGKSMTEMTGKFKSERLKKTFLLIVSGLRSGGQLTDLLDQTADNLRQERFLDEKIRTNVLMYVIFIFAAIGFGAPILFGLSSFLISVLETNLSMVEIPQTSAIPITFSQINVSSSFIITFAIISLLTSSVLGSLVLGLISRGKEKFGLKFIPLLVVFTLGMFFLSRFLIGSLLGGLFGLE